jgi:Fe-S cluster biogenesis protein NfuA
MEYYEKVQSALTELLPAMVADGGGAELVSLDSNGVVTLKLTGTCNFCPSRQLSAEALRRGLNARVPEITGVVVVFPLVERSDLSVAE